MTSGGPRHSSCLIAGSSAPAGPTTAAASPTVRQRTSRPRRKQFRSGRSGAIAARTACRRDLRRSLFGYGQARAAASGWFEMLERSGCHSAVVRWSRSPATAVPGVDVRRVAVTRTAAHARRGVHARRRHIPFAQPRRICPFWSLARDWRRPAEAGQPNLDRRLGIARTALRISVLCTAALS